MAFSECGKFVLKILTDEENEEYTEALRGVCFLEADFSDRCEVRKFVDGDRTVQVSDRTAVTLEFIREKGDTVQDVLLEAAKCGRRVGVICGCDGDERRFEAAVITEKISKGEIWGVKYRMRLCS